MKIFIELPTWLGDAVMASVAVENIALNFLNAKITFFGSFAATSLYQNHPNLEMIVLDESKKTKFRYIKLYQIIKNLNKFDIAISFRSHFASKFNLFFIRAKQKFVFNKNLYKGHQVEKYLNFVLENLNLIQKQSELKLYFSPKKFSKKTLGLNPGASYGSAKRWYPSYFAEVAINLKNEYDIIIFGSKNEDEICNQIAKILKEKNINFINLCGKTTLKELCENIAGLSLFITNDSGPMHIAASYKTPTAALFGPTNFIQTCPYKNENTKILHLNLECMPCMKRTCPIKTHECMKNLTPKMVLDIIKR
ncbi:lipopolysaccharide heptosyltransferase II [Campylobacter sputorum]|uniref:lipopolysaccharide heptosyltransferase II n=1 Tax=Campylobacter sputorum TaxID=206 RepID=UPI00053BE8B5|nr:lipopolysaccharide heptosyltransferase II [Campylobacter sputorum]